MRLDPQLGLRHLSVLFLFSVLFCALIAAQQAMEPSTPEAVSPTAYPNDSRGLLRLMNDGLLAARNNDHAKVQSMIRDMEIPNYENWFISTFGQEKGESWADPYGRWLQKNQKEFEELLFRLSQMKGQFSVQQPDSTNRYDTLKGPLDEYLVDWLNPEATKSEQVVRIADFYFVEGKFRWNSNFQFSPFQKPNKGSVVPAKLLTKVQPEYPAEARDHGIEGTVRVQIIIRKDGSVTVQNVLEGDPALRPAAVEAVRQWRYRPAQLNRQLIEMQTTVEVIFALNP